MKERIQEYNQHDENHKDQFDFLALQLERKGVSVESLIERVSNFQVAIPSWALGAGGTRFGRFSYGGEPRNLEEKIADVGVINALTTCAGSISLHIPWDIPTDYQSIKEVAKENQLIFAAVNSNTFQDQAQQKESYKYGSLSNEKQAIREQAIKHNTEVIAIGEKLGSKSITIWLADGSSFPGQANFTRSLKNTSESLKAIYKSMPSDWSMYIEYKPYEPNFYHTVIQDWGTSYMLASETGDRAYSLVDLGHHLPNTNIEHIVATLLHKEKLGGFHFNDSKYGDDDLTVGSIKPYQLFLIFNELVAGMQNEQSKNPPLEWMIDASHNLKDPMEDLIQSLNAILLSYAKALLIDQKQLEELQKSHDVTMCQELLQSAFRTDMQPLVNECRRRKGGAINPIGAYRSLEVRPKLIEKRGSNSVATGL